MAPSMELADIHWKTRFEPDEARELERFLDLKKRVGDWVDKMLSPSPPLHALWKRLMERPATYKTYSQLRFGAMLDHNPAAHEGSDARDKYRAAHTLYRSVYDEEPPPPLWPAPEEAAAATLTRVPLTMEAPRFEDADVPLDFEPHEARELEIRRNL